MKKKSKSSVKPTMKQRWWRSRYLYLGSIARLFGMLSGMKYQPHLTMYEKEIVGQLLQLTQQLIQSEKAGRKDSYLHFKHYMEKKGEQK